jgi:hypothetical protein
MARTIIDDIRVTYKWGPWIDWDGRSKKSPLAAGTLHQVKFRDGSTASDDAPEQWIWKHRRTKPSDDIVAYRIRKAS